MKKLGLYVLIIFGYCLFIFSCNHEVESGEILAKRYCSSCHLFTDPSLLDKNTWSKNVLPIMGAWLGVEDKSYILNQNSAADFSGNLLKVIPSEPLLTKEQWKLIQDFYINNSPDTLVNKNTFTTQDDLEDFFKIDEIKNNQTFNLPITTLIKSDTASKSIFVGKRNGLLNKYAYNFHKLDSSIFESSISDIIINNDKIIPLLMGDIMPNDNPTGSLIFDFSKSIIGLRRPVFVEETDFDNNGSNEYLIGNYGNNFGSLSLHYKNSKGEFTEKILLNIPGSIKAIIEDVNKDNLDDILVLVSQGDESIYYFENKGNLNFSMSKLLQFPPVYGTTDFEYEDIDNDSQKEIIVACGDNADYSPILKPYHGIRIFKKTGNKYIETKFLKLNGVTKIAVSDFDSDGKKDIAAVCNFADFRVKPFQNFILLKNENNYNFSYHYSEKTSVSRWLIMNVLDLNTDNKNDIVLGAHLVNMNLTNETFEYWKKKNVELLVLLKK